MTHHLTGTDQFYSDGYLSYPNRRINYPVSLDDEAKWLAGWYAAQTDAMATLSEFDEINDGRTNWLAEYQREAEFLSRYEIDNSTPLPY